MRTIRFRRPRRLRRGPVPGDRTGMRRYGSTFNTDDGEWPIMTNKEIIFGASDYRDLHISTFIHERLARGVSTVTEKLCVRGNHKKALAFVRSHYSHHKLFSNGTDAVCINMQDALVEISSSETTIDFRFHSTFERNAELMKEVLENFEEISIYISWIYDVNMSRATVPIDLTLLPVGEMYPFLDGEVLNDYYRRFMESRAGILILIGPPGTGKTSFIRGFLAATESSALVTYDEKILSNDGLFAEFIQSSENTLVLEDADLFLSSRKDGNEMMHKFLNVGDGLVTTKGKKMIFSTNLPNINDIDEALLRPGRCFDILHFGDLNKDETRKLVNKLGIEYKADDKDTHTIAEIFTGVRNTGGHKSPKRAFGFGPNEEEKAKK